MDFFARQDSARRRSGWLVVLFVLAVVGVVFSVGAAAYGVRWLAFPEMAAGHGFWEADFLGVVAGATLLVIGVGSGVKLLQLAGGGRVVAEDLGGRRIDANTGDFSERRLVNVVEEMAIAAGLPVPEIYVLEDEESLNAFAAGHSPSDAVIGVTRGCLNLLSRAELQGVVGHEFSHIVNGDMRLNLRLIGMIFGLVVLTVMGRLVLRVMSRVRLSGGGGRGGGGGAVVLGVFLIALALLVVGSIGVMFARMVKGAVSRQREFLADASAVQFTRNPDGIAGALKKIGGHVWRGRVRSARAEEASHLFFANGLRNGFGFSWFASHPPLEHRIRAIEPGWDGQFVHPETPSIGDRRRAHLEDLKKGHVMDGASVSPMAAGLAAGFTGGQLTEASLRQARGVVDGLPKVWIELAHDRDGARALVFALVLHAQDEPDGTAWITLAAMSDAETAGMVESLAAEMRGRGMRSVEKLALVDLAIPALRRMNPGAYGQFGEMFEAVVLADGKIDLFEWVLRKVVGRHLELYFHPRGRASVEFRRLSDLAGETGVLVSAMAAAAGHPEAFDEAVGDLGPGFGSVSYSGAAIDLGRIDEALERFDRAAPLVKKQLLAACGRAVMADGRIRDQEAELLRAVADAIGVPIPPFVREDRGGGG